MIQIFPKSIALRSGMAPRGKSCRNLTKYHFEAVTIPAKNRSDHLGDEQVGETQSNVLKIQKIVKKDLFNSQSAPSPS